MAKSSKGPPTLIDELKRHLETLRLRAMLAHLDEALEQAATLEQGYATFLHGLLEAEVLARAESAQDRRTSAARFPLVRTFETFDWTFQPGLNVQLVKDLMTLHFIKQARPVLLLGRPGTGKTHISIALGYLAVTKGYAVRFFKASELLRDLLASLADGSTDRLVRRLARLDLIIIDDMRHVAPRPEYATLLFDLVEARHLKKATIVSSNLSVKAWGEVLGNPALTASLVDRLMEQAHVLNIRKGRSYRSEGPDASPECPTDIEPTGAETTP